MTAPTSHQPDNYATIRLVAGRELKVRLRSRAFRITTLVLVLIVVGLCVVLKLIAGTGGFTVGYLDTNTVDKAAATELPTIAKGIGQTVQIQAVTDHAVGVDQVNGGHLDALLEITDGHVHVTVQKNIDANLRTTFNVLATQLSLGEQITRLGGSPAAVLHAAADSTANVTPLQKPYPYQTQQLILGIIAGILVYVSVLLNGQFVAQGVVEEKSSRVVELLLATVRPWQLMAGKVLGIGVVGLIQVLAIGIAGTIAGLTTKVLTISLTAAAGTIAWLILWYLLGFFMYSVVFAGLGALVSRQEEVAGVVAPATMFLVMGYILGSTILPSDPGSRLAEVVSVIPVFAPVLMPMRLAMGGVPAWEAILAVVIAAALIPVLIWVAARLYRNAVLRTGARVTLRQALRAA